MKNNVVFILVLAFIIYGTNQCGGIALYDLKKIKIGEGRKL